MDQDQASPAGAANPVNPPSSADDDQSHLLRYYDKWCSITNDSFILRIIREGYKIQFLQQNNISPKPVVSTPSVSKKNYIDKEISELLESGIISKVDPSPDQVVSRVFLVPKKTGDFRMIIDLSVLNKFINKVSFKMEDKTTIKALIRENDFMASIDLKSAFHSIPLHEDSKKFVVFEVDNQRYCYNRLVFGLTSSPRIFSKVLSHSLETEE